MTTAARVLVAIVSTSVTIVEQADESMEAGYFVKTSGVEAAQLSATVTVVDIVCASLVVPAPPSGVAVEVLMLSCVKHA